MVFLWYFYGFSGGFMVERNDPSEGDLVDFWLNLRIEGDGSYDEKISWWWCEDDEDDEDGDEDDEGGN